MKVLTGKLENNIWIAAAIVELDYPLLLESCCGKTERESISNLKACFVTDRNIADDNIKNAEEIIRICEQKL